MSRAEHGRAPDVVIVGHASIDDIHRPDGTVALATLGGAALYATVGATLWRGVRVGVVTRLGEDFPLDAARRASCHPNEVDWSGLVRLEGPSIRDRLHHFPDGSRTVIFDDPARVRPLTPTAADVPAGWQGAAYVHLTPADLRWQVALARAARASGSTVALDTEVHYLDGDPERVGRLLANVDILVPSIQHLQHLFGGTSTDPCHYWKHVRSLGPRDVVVKCGEDGCVVFDVADGTAWRIPALAALDVVDVTGAGDAFCGGFLAGMVKTGGDRLASAVHGTVAASFVVESEGAQRPPHLTDDLVAARLADVRARVTATGRRLE